MYRDKILHVIGNGGHARSIFSIIREMGFGRVLIYDDNEDRRSGEGGFELLGPISSVHNHWHPGDLMFLAIGDNALRDRLARGFISHGYQFTSLLHSFSFIAPGVIVGRGVVVMPGSVINSFSKIDDQCILNTSCSVDHDCLLGEAVHIAPGARIAGKVHIGARTCIGIGASVINNISIGVNVTIGAGCVVVRDVPDNAVVVGVPGKVIKFKEQ